MITPKKSNLAQNPQLNILAVRSSFFNFKYKWSMRKYWIGWFKCDLKRWYYSKIHSFKMDGFSGTMLPTTGKGKFVSVYSKGQIIQIKHESGYEHLEYDEIRIIPCKENHGVMVERFKNGKMCDRNHMNLNQFNKGIIFASNVEQLSQEDMADKKYTEEDMLQCWNACLDFNKPAGLDSGINYKNFINSLNKQD